MKGEDLKRILENNPILLMANIKHTIAYLLKKRLINPSTLIDEQFNIINEKKDKYKCHFIEADTCNYLLMEGNKEQKEHAEKRAKYNSKFNTTYVWTYKDKLSEEELKERQIYFEMMYGFNPENNDTEI